MTSSRLCGVVCAQEVLARNNIPGREGHQKRELLCCVVAGVEIRRGGIWQCTRGVCVVDIVQLEGVAVSIDIRQGHAPGPHVPKYVLSMAGRWCGPCGAPPPAECSRGRTRLIKTQHNKEHNQAKTAAEDPQRTRQQSPRMPAYGRLMGNCSTAPAAAAPAVVRLCSLTRWEWCFLGTGGLGRTNGHSELPDG